jgi:hypothetical protein
MKKFLTLSAMCALVLGAMGLSSCGEKEEGLPKPQNLRVENITSKSATLMWDAVSGAERYNVAVVGNGGNAVTSNSFAVADLTPDTEYTWSVQTVIGDKTSDVVTATFKTNPVPAALENPTGLTVADVTDKGAKFTWNAVTGATGYEVKISGITTNAKVTEPTYTANNLAAGKDYTWEVKAIGTDNNDSGWAAGQGFKTMTASPANLTVSEITSNGALCRWDVPASLTTQDKFIFKMQGQFTNRINSQLIVDGALYFESAINQNSIGSSWGIDLANCLVAGTEFTWQVCFVSGGTQGAWAEGPEFTSGARYEIATGNYDAGALNVNKSQTAGSNVIDEWSGVINDGGAVQGAQGLTQYGVTSIFGTQYVSQLIWDNEISQAYVDAMRPVAQNVTVEITGEGSKTGDLILDGVFIANNQMYSLSYNLSNNGTKSLTDVPAIWDYETSSIIFPYDATVWFNIEIPDIYWALWLEDATNVWRVTDLYAGVQLIPGGVNAGAPALLGTRVDSSFMPRVMTNKKFDGMKITTNGYAPYSLNMNRLSK